MILDKKYNKEYNERNRGEKENFIMPKVEKPTTGKKTGAEIFATILCVLALLVVVVGIMILLITVVFPLVSELKAIHGIIGTGIGLVIFGIWFLINKQIKKARGYGKD